MEELLDNLVSAVSEQQFTLNSSGWNREKTEAGGYLEWSKAGARKHQYDKIEAILKEINDLPDTRYV